MVKSFRKLVSQPSYVAFLLLLGLVIMVGYLHAEGVLAGSASPTELVLSQAEAQADAEALALPVELLSFEASLSAVSMDCSCEEPDDCDAVCLDGGTCINSTCECNTGSCPPGPPDPPSCPFCTSSSICNTTCCLWGGYCDNGRCECIE